MGRAEEKSFCFVSYHISKNLEKQIFDDAASKEQESTYCCVDGLLAGLFQGNKYCSQRSGRELL